jgi:hypothetical protein
MPSMKMRPASGTSSPASMSMRVVLPEPFGPMSAVTAPRRASTWTSSTARTLPKVRCTPWAMTPYSTGVTAGG